MRRVTLRGLLRPQAAPGADRAGDRARRDVRDRHARARRHAQPHVRQPGRHRLPARQLRDPRQGGASRRRRRASTAPPNRKPIPASIAAAVRRLPGVAYAHGSVAGYAQFMTRDGNAIGSGGGSTLGFSFDPNPQLSPYRLVAGQRAHRGRRRGDGQGDRDQAPLRGRRPRAHEPARAGRRLHDHRDRHVRQRRQPRPESRWPAFDLATAQTLFNSRGRYDTINVLAAPGADNVTLQRAIAQVLPPGVEVVSGQTVANELPPRSTTRSRSSRRRC